MSLWNNVSEFCLQKLLEQRGGKCVVIMFHMGKYSRSDRKQGRSLAGEDIIAEDLNAEKQWGEERNNE